VLDKTSLFINYSLVGLNDFFMFGVGGKIGLGSLIMALFYIGDMRVV
jgi:hypothetical protein